MTSVNQVVIACWLMLLAVSVQAADEHALYEAAVASPDRPAADHSRDESRHPIEILEFIELKPGMQVVELGAGGGYTTELVARVVGSDGRVLAQALQASRIRNDRLPNVTGLDKHMLWEMRGKVHDAGLEDGQVDQVLIFFALHDMYLN